jgi:hypothetical protein
MIKVMMSTYLTMKRGTISRALGVGSLLLFLLVPAPAQTGAVLSGTVTGPSGAAVSNAKISVKNLGTNQSTDASANSAGLYNVPNLTPGEYEVSISADGLGTKVSRVTLTAGAIQTLNVGLTPPADAAAPSLGDLGFSPTQAQGNTQDQARLDRRAHMLMVHQRLGLITTIPLVATLIASGGAAGKNSSTTGRDVHGALGIVTAGMYITTASYAIRAPRIAGMQTRGPIRVHKTLAWVHGTGMILTPILGAMAYDQRNRGEKVHGIASAHSSVAWVTGIAYGAAIASVSFKF